MTKTMVEEKKPAHMRARKLVLVAWVVEDIISQEALTDLESQYEGAAPQAPQANHMHAPDGGRSSDPPNFLSTGNPHYIGDEEYANINAQLSSHRAATIPAEDTAGRTKNRAERSSPSRAHVAAMVDKETHYFMPAARDPERFNDGYCGDGYMATEAHEHLMAQFQLIEDRSVALETGKLSARGVAGADPLDQDLIDEALFRSSSKEKDHGGRSCIKHARIGKGYFYYKKWGVERMSWDKQLVVKLIDLALAEKWPSSEEDQDMMAQVAEHRLIKKLPVYAATGATAIAAFSYRYKALFVQAQKEAPAVDLELVLHAFGSFTVPADLKGVPSDKAADLFHVLDFNRLGLSFTSLTTYTYGASCNAFIDPPKKQSAPKKLLVKLDTYGESVRMARA